MDQTGQDGQEHPPRVLIVDDEEDVRSLVLDVLREDNYELYEAPNGQAAQEILARTPMDVVITDLLMPKISGLGLMQWAQENHPGVMWIILSGRGSFHDAVRAVQLGAFDFITKPLDVVESLRVAVRNALAQRRLAAERERLHRDLAERNEQLRKQVAQLQEACGLLCEQAQTISQDLRRAELIQRALLPRVAPPVAGFCVDAVYRPSHNVGGDLYEVVRVNDRYAVVCVADAAGHGVSAAMLAVLFKHRIGVLDDRRNPRSPAEVLASVNDCLLDECGAPGLFITAGYCLLDTDTREIVAASAGHPPMLLHRAGGEVEAIYHTGPALGLAPQARFAQKRFVLGPGDRLLLYTDGLCEAPQPQDALTPEQIAAVVRDDRLSGQELLGRLLALSAERRGSARQEDDVTLVLLAGGEGPSALDNGSPVAVTFAQPLGLSPKAQVLMGRTERASAFSIEGRGTWEYCTAFHDACLGEIQRGRAVTLDLSLCVYLDSTFLGTIQEMAHRADEADTSFRIQGVLPQIRALFDGLGMSRVMDHIAPGMLPLPNQMSPMSAFAEEDDRNRKRILLAHEALASLNDRNRQEFIRLIEYIRTELAPPQHSP